VRESHGGVASILDSIGIIELLEQDERPTFIVDLSDSTNYGPGPIHPIFSNLSLKSYEGAQAIISGHSLEATSPGCHPFLQFKSWLLSATIDGESLSVCLPPFTFAGMTWTCSTLRRRLRVISGVTPATTVRTDAHPAARLPDRSAEALDYFGPESLSRSPSSHGKEPVFPTIEAPVNHLTEHIDVQVQLPHNLDLSASTQLLPSADTYVKSSSSGSDPDTPEAVSVASTSPLAKHDPVADNGVLDSQITTVAANAPSFDWTRLPLSENMPRHIHFARSIDWASTSLGPIEHWSEDLRQMCNLIMASPHPAAMYWGDDLIGERYSRA
jgi:hypothetical protein